MTRHELQRLLQVESSRIDWKTTGDPEKIVKTLAAYANDYQEVGSGWIICGVRESKHPKDGTTPLLVGISRATLERLTDRVFQLSRTLVSPAIAPQFESVTLENGAEVLVAWITASNDIHAFKGDIVIRVGDKVTRATVGQVAEMSLRKAHLDWLAQPCPGATLEDLDLFALEELAKRLKLKGGPSALLQPGVRIISSALPLTNQIETPSGSNVVPNRFAVLLAGREPHHFLPGAFVSLTRFTGLTRSDALFYPGDIFGPIPLLVEKVMGALETEAVFVTDKSQTGHSGTQNRPRYSRQALQEILVNSLAHRDYQSELSTKVGIFQDRIEFENPGALPASISIEDLKHGTTRWRNPSLARYLFELGLAQERGTGIPRAIQETLSLTGIEPMFRVDTWFKVVVPAYQAPSQPKGEPVRPGAGALVITIGYGTIDVNVIRRSHPAFEKLSEDHVRAYSYAGVVSGEKWDVVLGDLRDWLRKCLELPAFKEFHLFYRGPVAFGPLIGAIAAGRKPLVVYYFDEDEGIYRSVYRIDRRLLQAE